LMQERYRETVSLLENLLKDDPSRSEFWFLLSNARLALGEPDRAIVALECARRLKVASDESLATLADLYLNGGQLEEALARYKEAFAGQQPSLNRMLRASKAFILVRDPVRAAVLLEKIHAAAEGEVVELTPDQLHELNRLEARRAHLEGDLDTAARAYQRLIEDDPLDGDILLVLGDLYREKGELEEAMVSYEQASRIPDSKLNALIRRAQLEVERERYGKAVEFLEKAQVVKPQPHVARYLTQVRHLVR
ncbi:MAG: tetratricopeptide repeat protein, partial [Candidatus Auribacterota bacterium]|nr:tetratricopeptide repeat protein [Candidatus Auribacterota bacterium]